VPMTADPWPLRHLVLRTPRLELRPDDDDGLFELIEVARAGIHPPEEMPFAFPWTDAGPEALGPNTVRHHWERRASIVGGSFVVNFLVRLDGKVIGEQGLVAEDFPITREVSTGSWLGRACQGQGFGTEMRAAVLMFAFDHLGAETARSSALDGNEASAAVSRKLGYRPDGTRLLVVRGRRRVERRFLLTAQDFFRPKWTLYTEGADACVPFLASGQIPPVKP